METSIYQKLLYIYYLEYAIHHNSLSISSHSLSFSLIPSHFLSFPLILHLILSLLVRCRFYDIVSSIVLHILIPPSHFINQ